MIPLRPASAAQAPSTRAPEADRVRAPQPALILPRSKIFDRARIEEIAAAPPDADLRRALVRAMKAAHSDGHAAIAAALGGRPFAARAAARSYAWLTDQIVVAIFDLAAERLHPRANPTAGERIAVMAQGGYGRGEMAPFSDVDLLFLTPWKITPWAESVIESTLYMLWDLHLQVGHATRTISDCMRLSRADLTVRTALLERRFLSGDRGTAEELGMRLSSLFAVTGPEFVEGKLAERDARHERQGQRYIVEPNVKEGKGGLRDLHTLYWIARYLGGEGDPSALNDAGMFTETEFHAFTAAEDFLWAARCHLHLVSGRAMDLLTFDAQVEVADRLDYRDGGGRRAVEHFMQDYFRHATAVGDLTRIFLADLEAKHVRKAPSLSGFFRRRRRVRPPFVVTANRLSVSDRSTFLADRLNILRAFAEALRTEMFLHPELLRLIQSNLDVVDDRLRKDAEANRIFLDTLLKYGDPARALRRMNEVGLLASFVPEFEPIVAMMQFNLYHHYTVDEHIIQCVSTLAQIERGELVEELPIASRILQNGVNRRVLYLALFLHDIGKGRDEDHSALGARIARRVAARFGFRPADAETVEWLVRYHLLMSDMAQKRDLADPRTIRDFAKAVETTKRLDLLTVLTVCDIRGVGPGVWNNWKAQLLRELYRATETALRTGLEDVNRRTREKEAKRALRTALADWTRGALRAETQRHYGPYWQGLGTAEHVTIARLLADIADDEVAIELTIDADRDATRACFAMVDHPGIFSRLAGALALAGAGVVDARTYTSKDGYATAVFWIQDAEGAPFEQSRLGRLRRMICRTLAGEVIAQEALIPRDRIKKREAAFRHPTSITFDNDGSEIYTIIEVDTRDRTGLLFDLTRTLTASNVQIASAVIATYGAQVVDSFYVKDAFGLKLKSEAKRRQIERRLRAAIDSGAERALGK